MNDAFRREVWGLPEQFLVVPEPKGGRLPAEGRLILAALGGSAMAGEFLAPLVQDRREIRVSRDDRLPRPARPADAVLALSYSGNTLETLTAWREAAARSCPRAAVTSGGELLELAREEDAPRAVVPTGQAPRSSLGYLVRAGAALLAVEPPVPWAEVAEHLGRIRARWGGERGPAAALAEKLAGTLPALLAPEPLAALVARRWAADLAENAKAPAWVWELPEASHNAVMTVAREAPGSIPLSLVSLGAPRRESARRRWEALRATLADHGADVVEVAEPHSDAWVEALGLAYVGDWVSVCLADRAGVDAGSLSLMNDLKGRLAASGSEKDERP